jgi:hypothetical protein
MLQEEYGENLYCNTIKEGLLNKIPQELLTEENLPQTNRINRTLFHLRTTHKESVAAIAF